MKKTNILAAAAGIGVAGAAASAIGAAVLISKTIPRPKETSDDIIEEFADAKKMKEYEKKMAYVGEWALTQKFEEITITSYDGLKLHGYYLPAEEASDKCVIIHHGFTSKAMDNMVHIKYFHEQGYGVIAPDARAHGESEGKYVGFGILDRFDTLEWLKYAKDRLGEQTRFVLHGTSMGGATVLMALGVPEIQSSVSAVIADCGYTSPDAIFGHVMKKNYHLPAFPFMKMGGVYSQFLAGYKFDDYSTLEALSDNRVPVLFIHGAEDKFVPTWMSRENFAATTSVKKLLIVEKAGHGSSIFEDKELYENTEKEFLDEVFEA